MRTALACVICCFVIVAPAATAQTRNPSLEFKEFLGIWTLDETATQGLLQSRGRTGGLIDRIGFRAARILVLTQRPTEITVVNDGGEPEIYQLDGIDRPVRDQRTGAYLNISHRFTLVAGMLALTRTESVGGGEGGRGSATIVTDAYRVNGNVLTVERQHSVLVRPDGHLATLANQPRRSTLVYRRSGG